MSNIGCRVAIFLLLSFNIVYLSGANIARTKEVFLSTEKYERFNDILTKLDEIRAQIKTTDATNTDQDNQKHGEKKNEIAYKQKTKSTNGRDFKEINNNVISKFYTSNKLEKKNKFNIFNNILTKIDSINNENIKNENDINDMFLKNAAIYERENKDMEISSETEFLVKDIDIKKDSFLRNRKFTDDVNGSKRKNILKPVNDSFNDEEIVDVVLNKQIKKKKKNLDNLGKLKGFSKFSNKNLINEDALEESKLEKKDRTFKWNKNVNPCNSSYNIKSENINSISKLPVKPIVLPKTTLENKLSSNSFDSIKTITTKTFKDDKKDKGLLTDLKQTKKGLSFTSLNQTFSLPSETDEDLQRLQEALSKSPTDPFDSETVGYFREPFHHAKRTVLTSFFIKNKHGKNGNTFLSLIASKTKIPSKMENQTQIFKLQVDDIGVKNYSFTENDENEDSKIVTPLKSFQTFNLEKYENLTLPRKYNKASVPNNKYSMKFNSTNTKDKQTYIVPSSLKFSSDQNNIRASTKNKGVDLTLHFGNANLTFYPQKTNMSFFKKDSDVLSSPKVLQPFSMLTQSNKNSSTNPYLTPQNITFPLISNANATSTDVRVDEAKPLSNNYTLKNNTISYKTPVNKINQYQIPVNTTNQYKIPVNTNNQYQIPVNTTNQYQIPLNKTNQYQIPVNTTNEYRYYPQQPFSNNQQNITMEPNMNNNTKIYPPFYYNNSISDFNILPQNISTSENNNATRQLETTPAASSILPAYTASNDTFQRNESALNQPSVLQSSEPLKTAKTDAKRNDTVTIFNQKPDPSYSTYDIKSQSSIDANSIASAQNKTLENAYNNTSTRPANSTVSGNTRHSLQGLSVQRKYLDNSLEVLDNDVVSADGEGAKPSSILPVINYSFSSRVNMKATRSKARNMTNRRNKKIRNAVSKDKKIKKKTDLKKTDLKKIGFEESDSSKKKKHIEKTQGDFWVDNIPIMRHAKKHGGLLTWKNVSNILQNEAKEQSETLMKVMENDFGNKVEPSAAKVLSKDVSNTLLMKSSHSKRKQIKQKSGKNLSTDQNSETRKQKTKNSYKENRSIGHLSVGPPSIGHPVKYKKRHHRRDNEDIEQDETTYNNPYEGTPNLSPVDNELVENNEESPGNENEKNVDQVDKTIAGFGVNDYRYGESWFEGQKNKETKGELNRYKPNSKVIKYQSKEKNARKMSTKSVEGLHGFEAADDVKNSKSTNHATTMKNARPKDITNDEMERVNEYIEGEDLKKVVEEKTATLMKKICHTSDCSNSIITSAPEVESIPEVESEEEDKLANYVKGGDEIVAQISLGNENKEVAKKTNTIESKVTTKNDLKDLSNDLVAFTKDYAKKSASAVITNNTNPETDEKYQKLHDKLAKIRAEAEREVNGDRKQMKDRCDCVSFVKVMNTPGCMEYCKSTVLDKTSADSKGVTVGDDGKIYGGELVSSSSSDPQLSTSTEVNNIPTNVIHTELDHTTNMNILSKDPLFHKESSNINQPVVTPREVSKLQIDNKIYEDVKNEAVHDVGVDEVFKERLKHFADSITKKNIDEILHQPLANALSTYYKTHQDPVQSSILTHSITPVSCPANCPGGLNCPANCPIQPCPPNCPGALDCPTSCPTLEAPTINIKDHMGEILNSLSPKAHEIQAPLPLASLPSLNEAISSNLPPLDHPIYIDPATKLISQFTGNQLPHIEEHQSAKLDISSLNRILHQSGPLIVAADNQDCHNCHDANQNNFEDEDDSDTDEDNDSEENHKDRYENDVITKETFDRLLHKQKDKMHSQKHHQIKRIEGLREDDKDDENEEEDDNEYVEDDDNDEHMMFHSSKDDEVVRAKKEPHNFLGPHVVHAKDIEDEEWSNQHLNKSTMCQNGGVYIPTTSKTSNCICTHQFYGKKCQNYNYCYPNPCNNGGQCIMTSEVPMYKCECPKAYMGVKCDDFNPCDPNPCNNQGVCSHDGKVATCSCNSRFKGENCEELSNCFPDPCKNAGICADINGQFKCQCKPGFNGKICEEKSPCLSNPCLNDASCFDNGTSYYCQCAKGYVGKICKDKVCSPNPCKNSGTCMQKEFSEFACLCQPWATGKTCEDISPCRMNPCKNNARCIDSSSDFRWTLKPMQYFCDCITPYKGAHCEKNICSECHHNGHCELSRCECNHGYYGDGKNCQKNNNSTLQDVCSSNRCENGGKCIPNHDGSFKCHCVKPFMLPLCKEKDLCKTNQCGVNSKCEVIGSETRCHCNKGYSGKKCDTINRCKIEENVCSKQGACVPNGNNTYTCECQGKWAGATCQECGCPKSTELNVPSAYCVKEDSECQCPPGYQFSELKQRCKHTREYLSIFGKACKNRPCVNGGFCIEVDGLHDPTYKCSCRHGTYGKNCEFKKHCNPNPCDNGGSCLERDGKFLGCQCPVGYRTTLCKNKEPLELPSCHPSPCLHGAACVPHPKGGYDCICPPRFTGPHCQIDRCRDCDNNANCSHGKCVCKEGYVGNGYECILKGCSGQCLHFQTCINNNCQCIPGHKKVYDICIPQTVDADGEDGDPLKLNLDKNNDYLPNPTSSSTLSQFVTKKWSKTTENFGSTSKMNTNARKTTAWPPTTAYTLSTIKPVYTGFTTGTQTTAGFAQSSLQPITTSEHLNKKEIQDAKPTETKSTKPTERMKKKQILAPTNPSPPDESTATVRSTKITSQTITTKTKITITMAKTATTTKTEKLKQTTLTTKANNEHELTKSSQNNEQELTKSSQNYEHELTKSSQNRSRSSKEIISYTSSNNNIENSTTTTTTKVMLSITTIPPTMRSLTTSTKWNSQQSINSSSKTNKTSIGVITDKKYDTNVYDNYFPVLNILNVSDDSTNRNGTNTESESKTNNTENFKNISRSKNKTVLSHATETGNFNEPNQAPTNNRTKETFLTGKSINKTGKINNTDASQNFKVDNKVQKIYKFLKSYSNININRILEKIAADLNLSQPPKINTKLAHKSGDDVNPITEIRGVLKHFISTKGRLGYSDNVEDLPPEFDINTLNNQKQQSEKEKLYVKRLINLLKNRIQSHKSRIQSHKSQSASKSFSNYIRMLEGKKTEKHAKGAGYYSKKHRRRRRKPKSKLQYI